MLEAYTYDANGNRAGRTYGDDDRMTGTHVYDAAGFLVSRGADTFTLHRPRPPEDRDGRRRARRLRVRRVRPARRARGRRRAHGVPLRRSGQPVPRHREPHRRRAHAVLLRPHRAADRARARRRALLRRHRPGRHAARGHGLQRCGREDVRDQRVRRAQHGGRDRARSSSPLGFAGGIEDPVTGLVRFGLRDYEPATGRFTAKDPILHEGGMNLFLYAGNNPVSQRDPSGMDEGGMDGIDPSLLTLPTPGERIVGHFNKFVEWIKSEDGRDAIETIAEIPAEGNKVVKSVEHARQGPDGRRLRRGRDARSTRPSRRTLAGPSRRSRGSSAASGSATTCSRSRSRRWSSPKRRWTRCCRKRRGRAR